jgi:hypothetical protein
MNSTSIAIPATTYCVISCTAISGYYLFQFIPQRWRKVVPRAEVRQSEQHEHYQGRQYVSDKREKFHDALPPESALAKHRHAYGDAPELALTAGIEADTRDREKGLNAV